MIVSPASSTDIAFTGKGPRSPRLKWLGYITFCKRRSPSTGKVKVYQWINICLYLINCLYVHMFIVFCIIAIVRWFLAWINLGNGPELSLQFLIHFPFPLFHIWKREQIGPLLKKLSFSIWYCYHSLFRSICLFKKCVYNRYV